MARDYIWPTTKHGLVLVMCRCMACGGDAIWAMPEHRNSRLFLAAINCNRCGECALRRTGVVRVAP